MPFVNTQSLIQDLKSGVISECYVAQDIYLDNFSMSKRAPFLKEGFVLNETTIKHLNKLLRKGFTNIPVRFYESSKDEDKIIKSTSKSIKIQSNVKDIVLKHFHTIKTNYIDSKDKFEENVGRVLDRVLSSVIADLIQNPNIELCLQNFKSVNDLEGHSSRVTYLCGYLFFHLVDYLTTVEKKFRKSAKVQLRDNLHILLKSAVLHDIGKLQLDDYLINRSTRLSDKDLEEIKEKLNRRKNKDKMYRMVKTISDKNYVTPEQKEILEKDLYNRNVLTEEQYRRLSMSRVGNLLPEEMKDIEKHSLNGWVLMSKWDLSVPRSVSLMHHKFFNGNGYPKEYLDGRPTPSGKKIPVFARILTIIDVYDALTSDRPYRDAYHPLHALNIMRDMYFKAMFDEDIFKVFFRVIKPFQVGDEVVLSNGYRCLICGQNRFTRLRPKVVGIIDDQGEKIPATKLNNYQWNLLDNEFSELYITRHRGKDISMFTKAGAYDLKLHEIP